MKRPNSHFSPVFANKAWADESSKLTCYQRDNYLNRVTTQLKGANQWGRQRGLYSWEIENALDHKLENYAAIVYDKLLRFDITTLDERKIWAQFLLSQAIRTPTFMRYEQALTHLDDRYSLFNDRVGCIDCIDLSCITSRQWYLLQAHPSEHFIRSDNPTLISGFIDLPETCIYYPLSPRVCFVACSMPTSWKPVHPAKNDLPSMHRRLLSKGDAWELNFYLARSADESLILSPTMDGELANSMFSEVLGLYPQPPFALHTPIGSYSKEGFASIRKIMSAVDGCNYPQWHPFALEPFYAQAENIEN